MSSDASLKLDAEDVPIVRPPTLVDGVYEKLRLWLVTARIKPDERIKIDDIARRLGVSNTPIRQALGRLEADGLVSQEPHRGFIAANLLDSGNVRDTYDFRRLVEPTIASRAALKRALPDLVHLEAVLLESETADGVMDSMASDEEFHLALARIAGNLVLFDVLERQFTRSRAYRNMYAVPDAIRITNLEHKAILNEVEMGNPDAAAAAMARHLESAAERMLEVGS
jgi:DNA-binding GntR family transcriptional regulator